MYTYIQLPTCDATFELSWAVSIYIMYSWALVPVRTCTFWHFPQQEARKPPRMEAQLIFYFFSLLPPSRGYPIAPCRNLKCSKFVYLTYFLNALVWILLSFCSSVPQNPTDRRYNFFLQYICHHHRQEVIIFSGYNLNFTQMFDMCTTKPPRIDGTTFFQFCFYHHHQKDTSVQHNSIFLYIFL